jgi:hypothetical protein
MRLGVVFRSVAVLLAAPLLALPAGGAEDSAPAAPAHGVVAPPVARPSVATPRSSSVKPATRRADLTADGAERERAARPIDVHVDCAHDGCVVVEGLDVRVVGP